MWIILLYLEKGYTCISYKDNQYNKTLKKGMQKMHTNTGHINNLSTMFRDHNLCPENNDQI